MSLVERLQRHAATRPADTALEGSQGRLSYAGLCAAVAAAKTVLEDSGAGVLGLALDNGPAWVVLDIAALELGITLVPLPAFFSPAQLRHAIAASGMQALISDDPHGLRARLGDDLLATQRPLQVAGSGPCLLRIREAGAQRPPPGVHKVTFTSGTTGDPKGVMLSWAQLRPLVESLAAAVGMDAADRHLALMPLAVLLENIAGVYVPLWAGATVVLPPLQRVGMSGSSGLDRRVMAAALSESGATTAIFTPQTLQGLVESIEGGMDRPARLRFAAVGGAPVAPHLLQRATGLGLPVYQGYGLSECASVVCLNTPAANRPGSVGRPLPHLGLRIEDGEVVVRGQSFIGYLGAAGRRGTDWRTGDLGWLDADGYLYLQGRRRNVFITAFGRNLDPAWVEHELTLEPAIAQAAVFGEARPYNVAVVVPAADAGPGAVEAALARTNRGLPDYARVTAWLAADGAFSSANGLLTGTGRIRREAVQARYREPIESLYCEAETS